MISGRVLRRRVVAFLLSLMSIVGGLGLLGVAAPFSGNLPDGKKQGGGAIRILFLGDSLTWRFDWARALPAYDVRNFGIDGDTTDGVLQRLSAVIAENPDVVFLQIGINDYLGMEDWTGESPPDREKIAQLIARNHQTAWRRLRKALPQLRLYVCSLLPTAFPFDADGRINEGIREINARLEKAAIEENLPYIRLYPRLADAGGRLAADFDRDGVHLLPTAYTVWLDSIRPFLDSFSRP